MANILQGLFGGTKPSVAPADSDFADFASPPDPSPVPLTGSSAAQAPNPFVTGQPVPYTAWYRVWERTTPKDFIAEAVILPVLLLVLLFNVWGRRANRTKARNWAAAHAPLLSKEFAQVGFVRPSPEGEQSVQSRAGVLPQDIIEETNADTYISYATGRANIAFLDVKINLFKRYSPLSFFAEQATAFFFSSFRAPKESVEAIIYPFDGREANLIPARTAEEQAQLESRVKDSKSGYDGFVWAVVNKDNMRQLREDRYDISLTTTKDNAKLPDWVTVMTESGEISDQLLTPELVDAISKAGEDQFEHLIITDQPIDKPARLGDAIARKRLNLSLRLPSSSSSSAYVNTIPIFTQFVHLPDILAQSAHYRPEVLRRIKATRDEEIRKLRKVEDDEKAEERKLESDKKKKEDRDKKLKGLSADEQRKFLEKEREKDQRRAAKKRTVKG